MTQSLSPDLRALLSQANKLVNDPRYSKTKSKARGQCTVTPLQKHVTKFPSGSSSAKTASSAKDNRKGIREEWEALKNRSNLEDDSIEEKLKQLNRKNRKATALAGVVVYVETPHVNRATVLREILSSLGATVVESFTREVTHIVFKNGSIETFKRAKFFNVHLVSFLWVEACKRSNVKLSEKLFPVIEKNLVYDSPRVFRKFLECQSKHFEFDENAGTIIRKTSKNEVMSNFENSQQKNKSGTCIKNDSILKENNSSNVPEKSSSNSSLKLHFSTEDSPELNPEHQSTPIQDVPRASSKRQLIPNENLNDSSDRENELTDLSGIATLNINDDSENKSLRKKKLYTKRPLETSFIKFDSQKNSLSQNSFAHITQPETRFKRYEHKGLSPVMKNSIKQKQVDSPKISQTKKTSPEKWTQLKKMTQSSLPKHPNIVCTFLHSLENRYVKDIVKRLGIFEFKLAVDENTTHVVAGEPQRTINLLKGIARGCWIVTKNWIKESANAGYWLTEGCYELRNFSCVIQRCRMQKQAFGKDFSLDIFDDCGNIYINPESKPCCKDLRELVRLCSGKLAPLASANIVVGQFIIGKKCVKENWILDSITIGRCKTTLNYRYK